MPLEPPTHDEVRSSPPGPPLSGLLLFHLPWLVFAAIGLQSVKPVAAPASDAIGSVK
jgi:hypothetical protein